MTQNKRPNFLKRQFLIDSRFQLELMGYFFGVSMVIFGVYFWASNHILNELLDQLPQNQLESTSDLMTLVLTQHNALNRVMMLMCSLTVVFIIFGGLFLSHRVAGPILRTMKALRSENLHEIEKVTFRKTDYFHDMADALNSFIERFRHQK